MLGPTLAIALLAPPFVASPVPEDIVARFDLDPFYRKCVMVGSLPIIASDRVDDHALLEAAYLIDRMVGHRPDILDAMADAKTRFTVMASDEFTTDVPEHRDLHPAPWWDVRARGLGATRIRPSVSCGEENLLGYDGDPYSTENILIHEFAHAIHEMGLVATDPDFDTRLEAIYGEALAAGLWQGTYAAGNHREYWAECTQSWFDTNRSDDHDHNDVDTHDELRGYDPGIVPLLTEVYGADPWRYVHPRHRADAAHLATFDRSTAPSFRWLDGMRAAYDAWNADRTPEDPTGLRAMARLRRRAESGDPDAQVTLGWCYREGRGVPANDAEAVRWYAQAAQTAHPGGEDSLGWMYMTGRGVARDDDEAVRLFRLSARRGHAQGQYNLGLMIEAGRGHRADPVQAAAWFTIAARDGHEPARETLDVLSATFDDAMRRDLAALVESMTD